MVVISSELIELIGLCDRVVVMRLGKVKATLTADELSEEQLIAYATGTRLAPRFAAWPISRPVVGPTLEPWTHHWARAAVYCRHGAQSRLRYFRQRHERADPHGIHRHHRSGHVFRHHLGGHRSFGWFDGRVDRRLRHPFDESPRDGGLSPVAA